MPHFRSHSNMPIKPYISLPFLFSLFFYLLASSVSAQLNKGNYNFRQFESKDYYFGLTFGYNQTDLAIAHSHTFILNDTYKVTNGISGPGLNVSLVANMKLGDYFDFRFLPGFSFIGRNLEYVNIEDQNSGTIDFEGVLIQAPIQVRFKSDPFHDKRVFVLLGSKYTYDLAATRLRADQGERIVRLSPHDFSVEVGAGMQFFFPFFIFSPEIKYSHGIGNQLLYNNHLMQSRVIEKLYSRTLTISLNFEG